LLIDGDNISYLKDNPNSIIIRGLLEATRLTRLYGNKTTNKQYT